MGTLLRNRTFLFLWFAQAASGLGSTFAMFSLSWLLYEMTGSKLAMGSSWVAFMLPNIIVQLFSGPFLDRWERKKIMVASEWFRAMVFLIPLILLPLQRLETWHIFMVAIAVGMAQPIFYPAMMAYVADILPKNLLMKGNSLLEGTGQLMVLLGPTLGGLLISIFGVEIVLIILIIALGSSGLLLLLNPSSTAKKAQKKKTWLSQFKEGLEFYKIYPVLLWVGIMMMIINFSTGAAQPMFLPYVTDELGGSAFQYGLFSSAFSLGMVVGSLITGIVGEAKNRKRVMLGSLFINGLLFVALAWTKVYLMALVVSFAQGVFVMIFNNNNTTFYQRRVPDHIRGRVFSIRVLLAQAGIPFGAGLGGIVAEAYSIPVLFTILGLIVALTTAIFYFNPIFDKLNDHDEIQITSLSENKTT